MRCDQLLHICAARKYAHMSEREKNKIFKIYVKISHLNSFEFRMKFIRDQSECIRIIGLLWIMCGVRVSVCTKNGVWASAEWRA